MFSYALNFALKSQPMGAKSKKKWIPFIFLALSIFLLLLAMVLLISLYLN